MWNPFTVVDATHSDPTIYPVLSEPRAPLPFELEDVDGQQPSGFIPKAVTVMSYTGQGWTRTWEDKDLDFIVAITAARVVIFCEKFTKGGGWRGFGTGGLIFAGAANVVSHARAAARRQDKLLVAQIRYPWLNQIVAADGQGGGRLRLGFTVDSAAHQETLGIELVTPRTTRASDSAQHIAHAAARYRLVHGHALRPAARAYYEAIGDDPGRGDDPSQPGVWDLPEAISVGAPGSMPTTPSSQTPPVRATSGQWASDPSGRYQLRFHDGRTWTAHVSTDGVTAIDQSMS